jgi:predicted MPP superfamily phosphohydrolase
LFGFILASVVTVMQCYVFWRASSVPAIRRIVSRNFLTASGLVLWTLFLLCRYLSPELIGGLAAPAEIWSMSWMAVLFLVTVTLLGVEIATGFGFFLKRHSPRLRAMALLIGGLLSLISMVQGQRAPVVQTYHVYSKKLPAKLNGTVIVVLSDLHLGTVLGEKWLAARVQQVQAERPDVVLLLGDLFEGHGAPSTALVATLQKLSAPLGVWGVLGNHESHASQNDNATLFDQAGIHLLHNASLQIQPGLILAGVDDLSANQNATAFLNSALDHRPSGATVLMSHAPIAAKLAAAKGVDLMLSGHTHGGQIWPFGYIVRQQFPLLAGSYDVDGLTVIVSRGTGTWGPPMRLWRRSEIVRVTLHTDPGA